MAQFFGAKIEKNNWFERHSLLFSNTVTLSLFNSGIFHPKKTLKKQAFYDFRRKNQIEKKSEHFKNILWLKT